MSRPPKSDAAAVVAFSQLASSVTSRCTKPCPSPSSESATFVAEVVLQVGDDDAGAGRGQRLRHPLPESLGSSGDERGAAGQVEVGHGELLSVGGCGGGHNVSRVS